MSFFKKLSFLTFILLAFIVFFANNVLAECSGAITIPDQCTSECTNLFSKRFSKYDCPPGTPVNPDSGQADDCLPAQRVFNCSYPLWYEDSACTRQTGYNPCSTWCSVNGTQACGPGVEACKCSSGAICAPPDSSYTPTQLCTGNFQQSTHGGCLDASCGFFCNSQSSGFCQERYAYELTNSQQNAYRTSGAQTQANCLNSCFSGVGKCGDWCRSDVDINGRGCANGLSCFQGTCRNSQCLTSQDSSCKCTVSCTANQFDQQKCAVCNSTGTGYTTAEGGNWGTVGSSTTQVNWCSCAQRYDSSQYNKTKYPQCFTSTSSPSPSPGGGGSACPGGVGACGNSSYGELESCSGDWSYSSNTSYDTWCSQQTNGSNPYCYACISGSGNGGPGGPGICNPGASSNICRADSCVPGSTSTSP